MNLTNYYYDPKNPGSLGGIARLSVNSQTNRALVKEWLSSQDAYTLHRNIRWKFPRRKTVSVGIDHIWQLDLADFTSLSRFNDNFKFVLIAIDIFSRFAFACPSKDKSAASVVDAFTSILNSTNRLPTHIQTDKGREFHNVLFQSLLKQHNIVHYTSENNDIKCALVERLIRTLKSRLYRYFTYAKTFRYLDVLQDILHSYNNSTHTSLNLSPSEVTPMNEEQIFQKLYKAPNKAVRYRFSIGDLVRINRNFTSFQKGYEVKWSREIFRINKRHPTKPPTYEITDYKGEPIRGKFYAQEIQKVQDKDPEVFAVEKVLKTRVRKGKKEYLVRWLGYSSKNDSWVTDIII